MLLCIETSTEICSVAVVSETKVLSLCENNEGNAHASRLTLLIEEALKEAGTTLDELDGIAVSKGPGSYTGLRVGVSTAKGLCYALGKPLIAVDTLAALTSVLLDPDRSGTPEYSFPGSRFVPMIDARRMEVYCGVYDRAVTQLSPTEAKIIDTHSFEHELSDGPVYFFGNGASKCKQVLTHPNAVFVDHITCSASGMHRSAVAAFERKSFEDVAYFEPFYLKDFVGTTPKPRV